MKRPCGERRHKRPVRLKSLKGRYEPDRWRRKEGQDHTCLVCPEEKCGFGFKSGRVVSSGLTGSGSVMNYCCGGWEGKDGEFLSPSFVT